MQAYIFNGFSSAFSIFKTIYILKSINAEPTSCNIPISSCRYNIERTYATITCDSKIIEAEVAFIYSKAIKYKINAMTLGKIAK